MTSRGTHRWQQTYRQKLRSESEAARLVEPGTTVYLSGNAATPRALVEALAGRAVELTDVRAAHVLLLGEDPFAQGAARDAFSHLSFFAGPGDREAMLERRAEYLPCHLSDIPMLLRSGRPAVEVAMLTVAPPDDHGMMSLGCEVLASLAAAESARKVVVQVNPAMPRVHGDCYLHVEDVDVIVECEQPLAELIAPPPSDVELAIAHHIVGLIPDGATLQLGIGGIPNAVVSLLGERRDLGVHSEMISDGVMAAYEAGVLTGRRKTFHKGKVVTTFALGSREFYDWLDDNAAIEAHPCDHTNAPAVAAQNDRLISINSAISIDLTGQVNADSIGHRIYSGVGGQLDFVRAARLSKEGRSIIAMPSTAQRGAVSRILARLAEGAGVVTTRADVDTVVTEYGVAEMTGRTLRERAEGLIAIAAPSFQGELEANLEDVMRSVVAHRG